MLSSGTVETKQQSSHPLRRESNLLHKRKTNQNPAGDSNSNNSNATGGAGQSDHNTNNYIRMHHEQKDPYQKFTDDVQKTFEAISLEMWRTRVESIEGGVALWPEPVSLTAETAKSPAGASAMQPASMKATYQMADDSFQHLDFIVLKDYALRRAKVRTKKQRKADMNIIFQAFTDQAQRTQQIDRFMLSLILYFRYYLKHYKASRAAKDNHAKWAEGYLQALQASSRDQKFVNQFASNSNLAAAYSQTEIDGSAVVDDEADDGQIVQITLGYLQRNMENLMIIAGMSYMDILATRTDPTLPESWKEAYFNYLEVYLSESLKQVYINQYWAVIDVELQRLLKTEWFKINQIKTKQCAKKPLTGIALLNSTKSSAAGEDSSKPDDIKNEEKQQEQQQQQQPQQASITAQPQDKQSIKIKCPKTCPRAFKATYPAFIRPKTAPAHNAIDYSLYIDARVRRPRKSETDKSSDAGGVRAVTGSLMKETLSFTNRIAGNCPIKSRKLFPTLVSAYQAAIDGETIKEGLTLVAAGGKTGAYQMCLEARSPLVTAVLDPNFGKSSESKALPAKQEVARAKTTTSSTGSATKMDLLLSKTDSVGASRRPKTAVCIPTNQQQQQHLSHQQQPHDKRYSLAHFIESNRISSVLHSAWSSYERSIKNYGKDTNIDPVDEIQLRLSGFKWI